MTYLHQHSKTLNFELDFRNPKEQTNEREPRSSDRKARSQSSSSNKRTRSTDIKSNRDKRSNSSRHKTGANKNTNATTALTVPIKFQCRRQSCKQRGTSTNHTHNKCRFKDDVDTTKSYPNLSKAPPKIDKRINQNSSKKRSGAPVVPQPTNPNAQKYFSKNGATTPTTTFSDTRTCYIHMSGQGAHCYALSPKTDK